MLKKMMSRGVFHKGLGQVREASPVEGRGPCLNFLCHSGCALKRCNFSHDETLSGDKLESLGTAAQLLAAQRRGWKDKTPLSIKEMRERWKSLRIKKAYLKADPRENYGSGDGEQSSFSGRQLPVFHKDNPRPSLVDCDPAFKQALVGEPHPGKGDLRAELEGDNHLLASVDPTQPILRAMGKGPSPISKAAHMSLRASENIPIRVAGENRLFHACTVQKASEIALRLAKSSKAGTYRPHWPNMYKEAIQFIAKNSPSPVCDQAGRCAPKLFFRQGTSKKGEFVFYNVRAGREIRLQT